MLDADVGCGMWDVGFGISRKAAKKRKAAKEEGAGCWMLDARC